MPDVRDGIPRASRPFESPMTLAIRNSRAPVASHPSLVAARADEAEADPAQRVAADPSVIDAERHPLYGHGVESHDQLRRRAEVLDEMGDRAREREHFYDDAIHIAASGDQNLTLCGQSGRVNVRPFSDVWNDYEVGGQGCWTCLDARAAYESTRQGRLSRWQEQR